MNSSRTYKGCLSLVSLANHEQEELRERFACGSHIEEKDIGPEFPDAITHVLRGWAMLHYSTLVRRGKHWHVRVHDDHTHKWTWRSTGTGDKRNAGIFKQWLEKEEYERLTNPNRKVIALGIATDQWLAELSPRIREATHRTLSSMVGQWKEFFGAVADLRQIDAAWIERYLASRELAASSRNQHRSCLKWFLHGWALKRNYIDNDPTAQVASYPVEERKIRAFSDLALSVLLPHITPRLIHDFVVVALQTGLRQGTLLRLEWQHVDLEHGWLRVPAALMKSKRDFEAPLSPVALTTLKAMRDRVEGRVFQVSGETVRQRWMAALKRAGLPEFKLHDLRRTFLTNARKRGVPMEVAMALSDHHDLKVVLRCYRAVDEAELLKAVGRGNADASGRDMREM